MLAAGGGGVDAQAAAARATAATPSARDAFNAVLAVEQMMTTGGGWQDQIGGALEGARLTRSRPGLSPTDEHDKTPMSHADVSESLPAYSARVATLPPAAAAFLSRHVLCVFTGTCRLAATVARSVVDAWTRRSPGVERALRACAALGAEMTGALDRLGEIAEAESPSAFAGAGSVEARAALKTLGAALDKHRAIGRSSGPPSRRPRSRRSTTVCKQ